MSGSSDEEMEVGETTFNSSAARNHLHHTYQCIQTQLDDTSANGPDKLDQIEKSLKLVPDMSREMVDQTLGGNAKDPKLCHEESDNFREMCNTMTRQMYGDEATALPSKIDDLTKMILGQLGKRNGDELSDSNLKDFLSLWGIKPLILPAHATPRAGTFESMTLPHNLTINQYNMLRKKMGVKIKTAAEKDRFIQKLTKMSRHELDEFLINKRVKQV